LNKIIKFLAIGLGLVVTIVIAAIVILALTFNPNDYKDEISALVKSRTGRTLTIQDDLSLTFFPWIGVESGVVIFGNTGNFGPEPFARLESARISIKLLPLFKKQIQIDTVKIYGLKVSLITNPRGISNWDDLVAGNPEASAPTPGTQKPVQTPRPANQTLPLLAGLTIGGLDIRDAELKWRDQQTNSGLVLSKLNLKSGAISLDKPISFELSVDMQNEQPALSGTLELATTLDINIPQQRLHATALRLDSHLAGDIIPGHKADVSLKTKDIVADMEEQIVDISSMTLQSLGTTLSGELHGQRLMDKPRFQGELKIDEFNPRNTLQQLAITPPVTSDPDVLTRAALNVTFDASQEQLDIKRFSGQLDNTKLNGNVTVGNFSAPAVTFKLDIDTLDLDRYMPPAAKSTAATPAAAATAGAIELPLETLRALNLDGTARLDKLKVANLTTSDIVLTANARNGLIKLQPIGAKLYGGTYKGHIELDARGQEPAFSFDEQLTDLQAGPFLHDLTNTDLVSGTANAAFKIKTHGSSVDDLRKTLNGSMSFAATDGRINGLNLLGSIQQDYANYANTHVKDIDKLNQTVFSKFGGNVTIKNGFAKTNDTALVSAQLDALAKGSADLVTQRLDLKLEITPKKELANLLKGLGGRPIPYYITGTFTEPQFKNGLSDLLKQMGQEAIDREKARLQQKLEEQKRQEQEKLKQKEQEFRKKSEEEIKDKLKDILKF
jgi:AsmA protein